MVGAVRRLSASEEREFLFASACMFDVDHRRVLEISEVFLRMEKNNYRYFSYLIFVF